VIGIVFFIHEFATVCLDDEIVGDYARDDRCLVFSRVYSSE